MRLTGLSCARVRAQRSWNVEDQPWGIALRLVSVIEGQTLRVNRAFSNARCRAGVEFVEPGRDGQKRRSELQQNKTHLLFGSHLSYLIISQVLGVQLMQ